MSSLTISGSEREMSELSLDSGCVHYIHFHTNSLAKGINPFLLPPTSKVGVK